MSSFTVHDLDPEVAKLLRQRARAEGTSVNRVVKRLIEEALGVRPSARQKHRKDFEKLCGAWSKAEADEFDRAVADLQQVDPEDWR